MLGVSVPAMFLFEYRCFCCNHTNGQLISACVQMNEVHVTALENTKIEE